MVSSRVTFGLCEPNVVFKVHHGGETSHIPCNSTPIIRDKFQGRLSEDSTTKFVTLHNVTKSDAGNYTLDRTNGNGQKDKQTTVEVRILDPIWIKELFHNETERTITFTLDNATDLGTINWKIDGKEALVRHWRSHDNRTLTVAYNHTGAITLNVSNPVSTDTKCITLIRDLNRNFSNLCHIMYPNMTILIWDEAGDHTDSWTLIIPRNITNVCVVSLSDKMGEPQSSSHKHLGLIAIPFIVVVVLCKKSNKCRKCTSQDRHVDENHKNETVSMLLSGSKGSPEGDGSAAVIPSKDLERLSIDETAGGDATANDVDRSEQTTQIQL
ncbi:uncharacterized protein [Dendrobates tinctorius]